MRRILSAFAALSLVACQPGVDTGLNSASTVETATTRAGQALVVAWRAFDATLTAVEALRDAGVLRPGTPRAIRVADMIDSARSALDAATEAARIGNNANFAQALQRAQQAFSAIRTALGEQ
ncbi:MAG: hypothetical protein QOC65_514 [Sphingomonadales bacterium]|nr:hypothetical protein [Sphingomonadales bacterium]